MAPLWRHTAPLWRHVAIGNFRIEAILAHNGATWRMEPIWRHVANGANLAPRGESNLRVVEKCRTYLLSLWRY